MPWKVSKKHSEQLEAGKPERTVLHDRRMEGLQAGVATRLAKVI